MSIEKDLNERSPDRVLGNQKSQVIRELENKINASESTQTIADIINAMKRLEQQEKRLDIVKEALKEREEAVQKNASEENQNALNDVKRYLDEMTHSHDTLKAFIDENVAKIEKDTGVSIDFIKASSDLEEEVNKQLEILKQQKKEIQADLALSPREKRVKIAELESEEKAQQNRLRRQRGENSVEFDEVLEALGGKSSGLGSIAENVFGEEKVMSAVTGMAGLVADFIPGLGEIATIVEIVNSIVGFTKVITEQLAALRADMTQSINSAANNIAQYYGRIQSGLIGTNLDYKQISEDVEDTMSFNRFVKQTDYLNQIASLTDQGLVNDLEQRALLQTIKDKTLAQFNVTNSALTRLVRLGEQDSVNQFGLELALKKMLNRFGDSSYLQGMFDSVTSAILDASVVGKTDITNFNSTVQSWLGAMYSSGLSDNVVNAIASGINALGSGNVNALAQDESVQRLFLLSMDRIGMDYADILQQGLSSDDTNNLLASIIEYLNEIATNTNDNLVLKSSYSSLFNLSMSDMQAIQNVHSRMSEISTSVVSSSDAVKETEWAVSSLLENSTSVSERWENLFNNFSYTFGSNIAESDFLYSTYRIADITYNLLDKFSSAGGVLGKFIQGAKVVPAATQYAIGGVSMLDMLLDVPLYAAGQSSSLLNLLGTNSGESSSTSYATTDTSTTNFKTFDKTDMVNTISNSMTSSVESWSGKEDSEEDKILSILGELAKTLMKIKEGESDGYAFAVSLQGMSDAVLRSFASIFADEDAMLATFTGDNSVLTDALFTYAGDTTSNTPAKS